PGTGWVEFEPTASQAPLDRPSGEPAATREPHGPGRIIGPGQAPANGGNPLPAGETGLGSGTTINTLLRVIVPILLLAVLVAGGVLAIGRRAGDQGGLRLPPSFQTSLPVLLLTGWKEIGLTPPHWLERWARNASLTPMERAFGTVYRSLRSLGGRTTPAQTAAEAAAQLTDRLPSAARDIQALLVEYQRAQYGGTYGNLWVARRATESLHRQALRAVLRNRLAPLERVFRKKQ
ncbi:MAG TPA: hypothetical protein VL359_06840, partial [bacterium]|nr:hypothetical protein [bacterium]